MTRPRYSNAALIENMKTGAPVSDLKTTPPKKPRSQEESRSQRTVISWWAQCHGQFGLSRCVLHSVPNGGFRNVVTASIMKAEGQVRGVFDLKLNVARSGYHGAWLEMKAEKGGLSPDQKKFMAAMDKEGYKTGVAYSSREAIYFFTTYLITP